MKTSKQLFLFILLAFVGVILSAGLLRLEGDNAGSTLEKMDVVERVITFSPAAAEVIFALGEDEKLVGVSGFCNYPEAVKDKLQVGDSIYPNFERISVLNPDVVIIMGVNDKISEFCRRNEIEVLRLDMYDVEGLYKDIAVLGKRLGAVEKAGKLTADIKKQLGRVQAKVAGLERPKVFLSFFRSDDSLASLSTVGGGTHLNNLIEIAGGKNVFGDLKISYPKISKESLLVRKPEVIIEPRSMEGFDKQMRQRFVNQWQKLQEIPAVVKGRIYFPDADLVLKPGPRLGEAAEVLARMIHPEAFDE